MVSDKSLKNTQIHPLNLVVLDDFKVNIARIRNKTDQKYGKLIRYYIAPEAVGELQETLRS